MVRAYRQAHTIVYLKNTGTSEQVLHMIEAVNPVPFFVDEMT